MDDQGGRGDARELFGAGDVGQDGQQLALHAQRPRGACHGGGHAGAQLGLGQGKAAAADQAKQAHRALPHALRIARAREQDALHLGRGPGQTARAAGAHDAGQRQQPLGRGQRHALRDHAAHAGTDHVRLPHAQRVEHAQRVLRHLAQRVGRAQAQAELLAQQGQHQAGRAQLVKALRQAGVAVVVADHAVAGRRQRLHQCVGPGDELHAQAHDQQHGRAGAARVLHLDLDLAGLDFHRNSSSRSHLVAIHFSPASTGAPPCRVRVPGCARS